MVDTTGNLARAAQCARDVQAILNCAIDQSMVAHGIEAARRFNERKAATK